MQKVIFIAAFILLSGCSVLRNEADKDLIQMSSEGKGGFKASVLKQNLSNTGFFISKAEVSILADGENQKFITSIKFLPPDKYLISLRSKTGIEAVRAYVSEDTVLINDRLNRNLYKGRADYIQRKYGVPVSMLPVIFGDMIFKNNSDDLMECIDGFSSYVYIGNGVRYSYIVDCKKGKVSRVENIPELNSGSVSVSFSKFLNIDSKFIPTNIKLSNSGNQIFIKILKIELPWDGNLEFIPGNNYEVIDL